MLWQLVLISLTFALICNATFSADHLGNAHNSQFVSIDGPDLPMSNFKMKAVLGVNTAFQCGFTQQYLDLQAVWTRFKDRGLVVLGVPFNDFGDQEPETENKITVFVKLLTALIFH